MAESYSYGLYDNFVLEEKIKSILSTKLDMNRFMSLDYSLSATPGMVKKIHRYQASNTDAQTLGRLEGSTQYVNAAYTEEEYRVVRDQIAARYADDDQMTDPTLVDTLLSGVAEGMVNAWTKRAIDEYNKTTNQSVVSNSYALSDWANAINKYTSIYENNDGLFFLVSIDMLPTIQKVLGDDLKYVTNYIEKGAIATILGVPVHTSKALPKGIIFLANKDCVHAFLKKDVFVEQERDASTKENKVFASRYSVIALIDETKCIKMGKAQSTDATITTYTAGAKTVAGAATTGATVTVYVNGVKDGNAETAASSAYSHTCAENLAADDVVKIVVEKEGFLPQTVEVTVE